MRELIRGRDEWRNRSRGVAERRRIGLLRAIVVGFHIFFRTLDSTGTQPREN